MQSLLENQRDKTVNTFSNSFDESAPSLDLKPQRNCKSSTRMMNKAQNRQATNSQVPVPLIQNLSSGSGVLTAGSMNRKQGAFNSFMKTKQMQASYNQAILSQIQRVNTQNSFDMKNEQDLSNRSLGQTPGNQTNISNSFIINQYFGATMNQTSNKPITPHSLNTNKQALQQMIQSSGGQGTQNAQGVNQSTMDPYTYLRWKQQKYKSCRSIQASGANFQKSNAHIIANSAYLLQQKKGNQTQKTNMNNKSVCSSNGSALGSASMTSTTTGIKSLSEVKNPQMFIQWRFSDRKLTELNNIGQFKNLSDLDISGNLLQNEILELKLLQFLKKLNLSNNQISDLYPLPHNLEILNLSQNCLKKLNPDMTLMLKNLTTLDVSNNGLESLEGIQHMKRLKRLICKNNQIINVQYLEELHAIIEIDLENNPLDSYSMVLTCIQSKPDILVLNLKMSPVMLMMTSYDQLITEILNSVDDASQPQIDQLKKKLKFFSNGCLFRSKRVYLKIKTMQQHSKRSSSNFSNGSSSCGRAGANTGGRYNNTGNINTLNNNSTNAFSPLLNNTVTTPNQQHVTQRLEDIEQLYDEILDEEEEIERKHIRIHKRKLKKQGHVVEDESGDDDEDESLYEDDDMNPSMSCEEDIDDLQSYRNHNNLHNEFLNESTADFNKEIRQINQEMRDGDISCDNEHLQSLHSTQTISTNKKNPISFKLDLSKCTQQQSEEDDFDNVKGLNEDEDQFDIPGLQFVKVTDDSFRQMQKQQSQQQSLRNKLEKSTPTGSSAQDTKKNTLREYPPKFQHKPVVIPKLQLGVLQSNQLPLNKPVKHVSQNTINASDSKRNLFNGTKTFKNEDQTSKRDCITKNEKCKNEQCLKVKDELENIKKLFQLEKSKKEEEISTFRHIIDEIQTIFTYTSELKSLPTFIRNQQETSIQNQIELDRLKKLCEDLQMKCTDLQQKEQANIQNNIHEKYEQSERTISKLKEQLSLNTKLSPDVQHSRQVNVNLNSFDLKRAQSTQYDQLSQQLLNNPSYFYQTNNLMNDDSMINFKDTPQQENINLRSRKKYTCDMKRVKRPQSVVGHRKSSYCVKINSLLRMDSQGQSNNNDESQYVNEYGSTQEQKRSVDRQNMNQTMNKKVGHYIERLKERNSSLQERLNGSFGSGQQSIPQKMMPLNLQKVNLNLTQQQEPTSNPYIMTPSNEDQKNLPQSATNQKLVISSFTNHLVANIQKDRRKTNPDSISSLNDYSGNNYSTTQLQTHSKTQRIHVKKIQSNQFLIPPQQKGEPCSNLKIKNNNDTDYSINLSSTNKESQQPLVNQKYQTSERLNFYHKKKTERNINNDSLRESTQNASASSVLKSAIPHNHQNLSSNKNK